MKRPSGEATAPRRRGEGGRGPGASGDACGGGADPIRIPLPPFRSYRNTPCVGSGGRCLETSRYWPSAVHEGDAIDSGAACVGRSFETGRGFVPSALAIHRFSTPLRSLRNAIVFPSGENFGWLSNDMPPTIRFAVPPS